MGFTLIELLIALALVFILIGAVLMVYVTGFRAFGAQERGSALQGQAAQAVAALSADLRGATSLAGAGAAAVTFTADTDADGVDEGIEYSWSGTAGDDLVRAAAASVPAAHSVQSLVFSYYDAGDNLLDFPVTASQVRRVGFDLTLSEADEVFRLRSSARPRNL
ncbi:MAG: hypothetical protein HYT89_04030 [Candidatus Omnitrophica bacterium]|nr:hypothetical protein [Candidatus Omnitrophota bacterium]